MFVKYNQHIKTYGLFFFTLFLFFATIFIFYLNWENSHRNLTFAVLNVGQGEALFIESPTGTQILIDGGPPKKTLSHLARVMPIFDRTIDAVVITNPDADHIGGLIDILKVYKVGQIFEAGTYNDSKIYQDLKKEIKDKNISNILAKKEMRLYLGGGAFIDILFPDRDVSQWTTNDGSVVAKLSYGNTRVMLTGDATKETEKIILQSYPQSFLESDILKIGHHGSQTSTSYDFMKAVSPQYALISNGKNNKYGHPHKNTLDTILNFNSQIFRTDLEGTIIMKSNGIKETFSFIK
ncbi:MAG: MBL fold metallo-hydrolase [Patescibacteria group bacterium]